MLTGSFRSYPISSITIAPERQRKELTGIEELASSIRTLGLIHPIVITPDGVLVAGERRMKAHELLGLTHIFVQYTNDLPREELELLELEENVKRKSLTWKEEVAAVARLHSLKLANDPNWRKADTAEALSVTPTSIFRFLLVADYMAKGEELVINADNLTTAYNICLRKDQRAEVKEAEAVDTAMEEIFGTPFSLPTPMATRSQPELPMVAPSQPRIPYKLADFREWSTQSYTGAKFNFIHCDFPYGINFDKHNGGATGILGGYSDTPELYLQCLEALEAICLDRVADSAHIMFWLSAKIEIVHSTRQRLELMGWKINSVPLIWHRNDNAGILPDAQRGPRQVYETCLFGSRGDRKIVQAVSNLYAHPKTKDIHASEKPRMMLQHFFRMFVDNSTVMLDPTMGSGNAVLAAEEADAKSVLGLEALPEIYENAVAYRKQVKARV